VGLEELGQLKNQITSSGIKPATCRIVAQCLNQLSIFEGLNGGAVRKADNLTAIWGPIV
jgi:hypothetical protein